LVPSSANDPGEVAISYFTVSGDTLAKRELFERLIDELRKQERHLVDGVESWRAR
jgi:hypothetical protein